MPFCPECKEEYDENVQQCADCGVNLVDSLTGVGNEIPAEVKVMVASRQVGEHLVDLLLREGVEASLDAEMHTWNDREVHAVKIPGQFFEFVAVFLTRSDRFQVTETDENGKGLVDFFDPLSTETVRSHPLMRKKNRDIAAMGEAVIPELITLLKRGEVEVRRWAIRRLLDLGMPGMKAMQEAVFQEVLEGNRDFVFPVVRGLDEGEEVGMHLEKGVPDAVIQALSDEDASVRAVACLVTGKYGTPLQVAPLVSLLGDPEPLVLEEVVEAIDGLTGIDLDLHAGSSEEDRRRAVQILEGWIKERAAS